MFTDYPALAGGQYESCRIDNGEPVVIVRIDQWFEQAPQPGLFGGRLKFAGRILRTGCLRMQALR